MFALVVIGHAPNPPQIRRGVGGRRRIGPLHDDACRKTASPSLTLSGWGSSTGRFGVSGGGRSHAGDLFMTVPQIDPPRPSPPHSNSSLKRSGSKRPSSQPASPAKSCTPNSEPARPCRASGCRTRQPSSRHRPRRARAQLSRPGRPCVVDRHLRRQTRSRRLKPHR